MLRRLKAEVAQQLTRKEHVVEMLAMGERQAGIYREAVDKLRQRGEEAGFCRLGNDWWRVAGEMSCRRDELLLLPIQHGRLRWVAG